MTSPTADGQGCEMDSRFKLARSRALFSRLLALSDRQQRELESNPGPFIEMAYQRLYRATKALEDARWELIGGPEMLVGTSEECIRSMESVLFERHKKALDIIDQGMQTVPSPPTSGEST